MHFATVLTVFALLYSAMAFPFLRRDENFTLTPRIPRRVVKERTTLFGGPFCTGGSVSGCEAAISSISGSTLTATSGSCTITVTGGYSAGEFGKAIHVAQGICGEQGFTVSVSDMSITAS